LKDRDKFLTEWQMGWEWSEEDGWWCVPNDYPSHDIPNFSTWSGFGKLWEWAKGQSFWGEFKYYLRNDTNIKWISMEDCINPDNFANALYEFLKGKS